MPVGDLVYIRYKDHTLYRDSNPSCCGPMLREAVGWLSFENTEFVRVAFERFAVPESEGAHQRETGIAVLKSAIIELRSIG